MQAELRTFPFLIVLAVPCFAIADTDPITAINQAFINAKVEITRQRMVEHYERTCSWSGEPEPDRCHMEKVLKPENYKEVATVKSAAVVIVNNFKFLESKQVALPSTVLINAYSYKNCGPQTVTASANLSVSGAKGWSITKTHSVSSSTQVGMSQTFTGKTPFGGSSTTFSISKTFGLSDTTSNGETYSETVSQGNSVSVTAMKGESGYVQLIAYQVGLDIPFKADVVLDGDLSSNVDGKKKASEFLSQEQRTVPFEGVLHLTGVTNAIVNNYDTSPAKCDDGNKVFYEDQYNTNVPADIYRKPKFKDGAKKIRGGKSQVSLLSSDEDGPVIGAPDGISYTVISRSQAVIPSAACGYNDLSIANNANYTIEERRYEQHNKGVLVASWNERVEIFNGCASGP